MFLMENKVEVEVNHHKLNVKHCNILCKRYSIKISFIKKYYIFIFRQETKTDDFKRFCKSKNHHAVDLI